MSTDRTEGVRTHSARPDESVCDDCGRSNPVWWVDSDRWNLAVDQKEAFLCPSCFVSRWEAATGLNAIWHLAPTTIRARAGRQAIDGAPADA